MGSLTLTPGPSDVEKVVWSRNSAGDRIFEVPCTGARLANRDGVRDDMPPFTCGTYPRRAVIKHFLRKTYGGGSKDNAGAKQAVVAKVRELISATRQAWSLESNFLCTCPNKTTVGWGCCTEQSNCATQPCSCPDGYNVAASVACCTSVCGGLAGSGLMAPFSSIDGDKIAQDLLAAAGTYLRNQIWTSNDPWTLYDPLGSDSYRTSWTNAAFEVADAGLFDASRPVVYYDEITYPFRSTFWEHCTGLMQQLIWTMPISRTSGMPKGVNAPYDPIKGQPLTPNVTYTEDFIQSLVTEAYKSSPVYWHYNIRHTPSQSEVCQRTAPRKPGTASFNVAGLAAAQFGFSSMTLGGLGGADCYCGWWNSDSQCRIPDALCASLVQILGFTRICVAQRQVYNASDHRTVLASIQALLALQPNTMYPCPSLQISDHWGFLDPATGQPFLNATNMILTEGVSGFRVGNADWLFATQTQMVNPFTRAEAAETPTASVALQCDAASNPSIADHFIDELFPSAQGVRQSMPQSYCTRYGIELTRLTVYQAAGLKNAASQQQGTVDKWKLRCQYKLEELAVCNSFKVYSAAGGPTDTSQCPFALSVVSMLRASYAVTPGCLLVLWNTPNSGEQDGIYDPCICVSCADTPNIDVPAQLTSICKLESFQQLVGSDVVPGETSAGVPLGSGSFRSLMDKPGLLQVNTPDMTHWALHTSIRDADRILDWWPWQHPTGYHVTPGCSRPKDAHWKTFDASWRWDSQTEKMVFARDESNDPLLSRNAFGASGVCRTSNYGMPLTVLNSMAVCTKENKNAKVDPMVPAPAAAPWVDGSENCAPDAFSTPWSVDRTMNPPRQWAVGTLQQETSLAPPAFKEWGPGCGPYPLCTCTASSDCAAGLTCIVSAAGASGVCGYLQPGKFACTSHAQCSGDLMCAGDGLCVQGVWQVTNSLQQQAVSFRSYTPSCRTGVPLDTWGTSIAETLPDVLNASGLCSYRSWFENRRMASRNQCEATDVCQNFSGTQPWNFSAPSKQLQGQSAFDSGVLRIQPHPCDRDYQFFSGFRSCTPGDSFTALYDGSGSPITGTAAKDNRTITYRVGKKLPLIHHMDEAAGPTFGFTGIPKTYKELNLGTDSPTIIPCTAQKVCSLQPRFTVNNHEVDKRLVMDSLLGVTRGYTVTDLLGCGVFGILQGGVCQLDYAVVPLAWYVLGNSNLMSTFPSSVRANLKFKYNSKDTGLVLQALNLLPDAIIANYIGGSAKTLQDYVSMSNRFVVLYNALGAISSKPIYPGGVGAPNQLYYLTQFGAYEVPFAWWYKCVWLAGNTMGTTPLDESICSWQPTGNASQPTGFGAYDSRLTTLFNMAKQRNTDAAPNSTLIDQLISLPGIITQRIIDQAYADYSSVRNGWMLALGNLLQPIQRKCFTQKNYNLDYSSRSQRYQLERIAQMYNIEGFDLLKPYLDSNNATVCTGASCLDSVGYSHPTTSNSDFAATVMAALKNAAVSNNTIPLRSTAVPVINGAVAIQALFSQAWAPVWSDIASKFPNIPNNCSTFVTSTTPNAPSPSCLCTTWKNCSQAVQTSMLERAKLKALPSPLTPPYVTLKRSSSDAGISVDACSKGLDSSGTCFLNDGSLGVNFSLITEVVTPVGVAAETYVEDRWDCVKLSCGDGDKAQDGLVVPAKYVPYATTTKELITVQEYAFWQRVAYDKQNPWPDLSTQQNEILCEKSNRFQKCGVLDLGCCEQCTIAKERSASVSPLYRFRARTLQYAVNGTLVASLEFYPCIEPITAERFSVSQTDYDLIANSVNAYRGEAVSLTPCSQWSDSNGMPIISKSSLRSSKSTGTQSSILDAISNAISGANKNIVDSMCMASVGMCLASQGSQAGSIVQNTSWSSSQINDKCSVLANDNVFGCMMWPGETTTRSSGSGLNDLGNIFSSSSCSPDYDVNHLKFPVCMNNNAKDPCQSSDQSLRDMRLSGNTFTYNLQTTSPICATSPVSKCTLLNETKSLTNTLFACPGVDRNTARNVGYSQLAAYHVLNTNIPAPQILPQSTDTTALWFDHLFLSLSPGYMCYNSQPACQSGSNQLAVEMLRNLWLCLECPLVSPVQCTGLHNCLMVAPQIDIARLNTLPGWSNLPAAPSAFLTGASGAADATIDVAAGAVAWLVQQVSDLSSTSDIRLSYDVPAFMTSYSGTYEYNPTMVIQHDAAMQVNSQTCSTTSGTLPDFSSCSYDIHRQDLKRFVGAQYKTADGVVIPPGATLQWQVGRAQATSQNIPQWESLVNRTGMFLVDLFDDRWCLKGNLVDNACYVRTDGTAVSIDVLNPGLLGSFEPSVGCDTAIVNQQRVISSVCGDCADPSEYSTLELGDTMQCSQSYDAVKRVTTDSAAASNLCSKTPFSLEGGGSTTCKNLHGVLGGREGGSPVDDIYARVPWTGGMPTGISQNPLFQGKTPPSGAPSNIALSPSDIGGHYVRMVLGVTRSGAYTFSVQGLPLASYSDALSPAAYSLGVSSKLWTQANAAQETFKLTTTLYPNSVCASWDCPLRRRAFYMGVDDTFRPNVPDPLRTQILYGTMAHPTQAATPMPTIISQTASRVLGIYSTSNGFCACMAPPCACAPDTASLYGTWTNSSAAPSSCTEQLDWPYAGGQLRDGTKYNQRWSTVVPCGVLDRLPTFQYRYKNRYTTSTPTTTTLDKGGVCHMGWPVVTAGPLAGCYLLVETDTYMCPWFLLPKNVTRLRAKTVDELLASPTRPQLKDCSPPPEYRINNNPTAPEVSYGQLRRWDASRLLANDLRRQLCGNSTVCEPSSQWSLPTFWSNIYAANFPPIPDGNGANESLWSEPWVACVQHPNGTQTCDGTIPRHDWATGDRPQLCMNAFANSTFSKNLTQSIDVCDLDSSLDLFCRTIQDARYQVFEANCMYSGQCTQQLFFYQPSIYEINNNEFVRNTVQNFYNGTIIGACIPDQDTAAAIESNAQDLDKCSAMRLNVLVDCIQIIRAIVGTLVELVYYWFELLLNVFELIGAKSDQEKQQIIVQVNSLLALLKNKFILLFNEIGDLIYKILFDGPMGAWLITMIKAVCAFIDWLFSDLVYVILCWVRTVSLWVLNNVATGFVNVLNSIAFGTGAFNYLYDDITAAVTAVENNINCTPKELWSCNIEFLDHNASVAVLPMPTRCWAGAEPQVGGSLACTAADTCIQQDYTNIICGACPQASSMIKFGCNSLTKLCSCNVFPVGISSCASHQECTIDSSDVSCRYVDSYLQPSYGNVPCTQCPNPICLILDGTGVGQCSCLLRPVPSQTCSGIGQIVSPDARDLCLLASAGSGQGSTNSYSADYRTLSSLPCMLLNQAQSYCMTVFTSATVSTPMVVGLAQLKTRRRLLWWEDDGLLFDNETVEFNANTSIWQGRGEPCRSLMMATELGVLERYAKGECWRWYEVGMRLTIEANMTGVSPFLLVSWRDLVDTMLDKHSLVEIMAKLPAVMHRLLLHSEFSQPVYLFIAYWSALVPREVWSNQTLLDGMKERMFNASTQAPTGRRLLAVDVINSQVSSQTAYEWSQGPYSWPPNFQYWNGGEQSCAVASMAIEVVKNGLDATVSYYQSPKSQAIPVSWPALPIRTQALNLTAPRDLSSIASVSDSAREILSNITDAWLDRDQVRDFLRAAPYMSTLKGFIQCNFTRVQTCDGRHPLFWSAVQTGLITLAIGAAIKLVEIPYLDTALALSFVPIFLYITYGYSPMCIPLLPTCMLSDAFGLVDWLLPPSIVWPEPLVTEPNCTAASCLRSCVEDPVVGFSSFYDHAAWIMCEMNPTWAVSTAFALQAGDPVRMAVLRKCAGDSEAMQAAQRICFCVTVVRSAPILLAAATVVWLAPSVFGVVTAGVQFAGNLLFTFVLFVHSRE